MPQDTTADRRLRGLDPRAWRRWWQAMARTVDHPSLLADCRKSAAFGFNYLFMLIVAAGIATIGLLVNSPAVIIGAMLVSPLMGPIVSAGVAIATFDVEMGVRAVRTLLIGSVVAVLVAAGIVLLSPVTGLTTEILARTRPNLFDLVVAILSGAAGGYALVRGQGGAVVGVAIATALMPPLAVVGYGLAMHEALVLRGSLLLFITNMAAIALAVGAVAVWYGFGRGELRKRFARQAVISLLVLAPLAVPLTLSLRSIAWEARVNTTVRSVLTELVGQLSQGELAQVRVNFGPDRRVGVEALVISSDPKAGLQQQWAERLQQALATSVALHLTHLRSGDPQALAQALQVAPPSPAPPPTAEQALATRLRDELPFALAALTVDASKRIATVVPTAQPGLGLAAWRDLEAGLSQRHVGWQLQLVPPTMGLPAIAFANGTAQLDAEAERRLELTRWALQRWGLSRVQLVGHASSTGGGPRSLAQRRLDAVGGWLQAHGVATEGQAVYPVAQQAAQEREAGQRAYRRVEIVLPADAEGADARR
jgi:uncharacterized hydrophobic protein (TIGR00271 family)